MHNFPVNYFSPKHQRDFIIKDLGPALAASCHPDVHLIIMDDVRFHLPKWANQVGLRTVGCIYPTTGGPGLTTEWSGPEFPLPSKVTIE